MTVEIRALLPSDDRSAFDAEDEALNLYFHRYAGQNQFRHHIGVTYVAIDNENIFGFATVSPASLDAEDLPSGKKMPPYPVPVLRIARLAVDRRVRGQGLGKALLRFCLELAEQMQKELGCVGIVVDAKANAIPLYELFGFVSIQTWEGETRQVPRQRSCICHLDLFLANHDVVARVVSP